MLKGFCNQHIFRYIAISFVILISGGCRNVDSVSVLPKETIIYPVGLSTDLSSIKIIFAKNQNDETSVHITTLDSNEKSTIKLLNEGGGIELSPDGGNLVYDLLETFDGEYRSAIWIRGLTEGIERRVILWPEKFTDVSLANPSFFLNENKLIFSITWYDTDTIGLAAINLDGSNLEIIETPLNTFSEGPIISPDGEKILVLCEGIDTDSGQPGFMICIMNRDGSGRILLTKNGDYHGTRFFTPDSQNIIYSETEDGGVFGIIKKPYYQIRCMDIDGKNDHLILDWNRPVNILAISTDGEEVIFIDRPKSGKFVKMYLIQVDGTNLRHLAYFDDFLADWYPSE